jgi:hypothetical protein
MNIVNRIATNPSRTAEKSAQIIAHNYGLSEGKKQIDEMVEHDPQVVNEILLKPRDFRSIGDFPEAAELSKTPCIFVVM